MSKKTTTRVAKPAHHAKSPAEVGTLKHKASSKHDTTKKKTKHSGSAKHGTRRGWSPDETVACCAARAVAEHLRITRNVRVSDDDILTLHRASGADDETGSPVLASLMAARDHGLAGWRLAGYTQGWIPGEPAILGIRLPDGNAHTVAMDSASDCWSWGEPFDCGGSRVEEVWMAGWAA